MTAADIPTLATERLTLRPFGALGMLVPIGRRQHHHRDFAVCANRSRAQLRHEILLVGKTKRHGRLPLRTTSQRRDNLRPNRMSPNKIGKGMRRGSVVESKQLDCGGIGCDNVAVLINP